MATAEPAHLEIFTREENPQFFPALADNPPPGLAHGDRDEGLRSSGPAFGSPVGGKGDGGGMAAVPVSCRKAAGISGLTSF